VLRPRKWDRGVATIEYTALLLVLALVVGGLFAAGVPAQASSGAKSAICKIFSSGDCGSRKPVDAKGGGNGGKNGCQAFCPTKNNPIHPSDPVTAATKGGYVALGDSYSSGEGAADQYLGNSGQTGCHRAPGAYSQGISNDFHFQDGSSFVACSGATTDTIMTGEHGEGSELDALNPRTTLVTVSAGGNDVHFADIMTKCILDPHFSFSDLWPGNAPAPDRCAAQRQSMDADMNTLFGGSPSKYEQFLETVHQRAPNARIVVVGYPRLFPEPPTDGYLTVNRDDQRFLNDMADRLNGQIQQAVANVDARHYGNGQQQMGSFEFVNNDETFKGHELTTDDPWLNGVHLCAGLGLQSSTQNCQSGKLLPSANTSSFHPTARGQQAFEEAVRRQIQNGPNRTLYDP
jgi:lysophospholipase L1-like esterase